MSGKPSSVLIAWACALALLSACGTMGKPPALTQEGALQLAVTLANEACEARYQVRPFAADSYPLGFDHSRWTWGHLDVAGVGGYSAVVSFDSHGEDREVEVYLSTDALVP